MWGSSEQHLLPWQLSSIADMAQKPCSVWSQRVSPSDAMEMWVFGTSSPRMDGWVQQDLQLSQSCSSWWPERHFAHPFLGKICASHPTLPKLPLSVVLTWAQLAFGMQGMDRNANQRSSCMAGEGCGRRKAKGSPRNELHSHIFQADRAVANHSCAGNPNSSGETQLPLGGGKSQQEQIFQIFQMFQIFQIFQILQRAVLCVQG